MKGTYEHARDQYNKIYFCDKINECPPHFHKQVEIIYINQGEATVKINDDLRILKKGSLAISDSYDVHSYKAGKDYKSTVIIFPFFLLKNYFSYKKDETFKTNFIESTSESKKIFSLIQKFENMENPLLLSGLTDLIFYMIISKTGLMKKDTAHDDLIREILLFIEKNYSNPLNLEIISKYFSYSTTHFSHIFNANFGMSLNEYINSVRINKFIEAKSHMPESSTSGLAFDVGFNSLPTFYRAFIKQTNTTPEKYWGAK